MSINSFDNYPMSWKPDLSRTSGPKYLALVSLMEEDIKNGTLKAGTKLPPQRELADYLNVNLSTISRAFKIVRPEGPSVCLRRKRYLRLCGCLCGDHTSVRT